LKHSLHGLQMYRLTFKTVIMTIIKNDIQSVSKHVVLYQHYVHCKVSLQQYI
jgi:hypothetical protein